MTVIRSCCCPAGLLLTLCAAWTAAAAPTGSSADDSYGRGVHAYFSGNCAAAEPLFARAMGDDPRDPRPYYFRALCLLRQGRSDEARSDLSIGAALEARSPGSYAVGKSLERVQGGDRLTLEQIRWQARIAVATGPGKVTQSYPVHRATVAMHTDEGALRQKVSVPLDRLAQPVSLAELANVSPETPPPVEAATSTDDPFADDPRPAPGSKIPAGKLLGIFGRAIVESAPVPSLEGIREQIPEFAAPATNNAAPAADPDDPFGADAAVAPATDAPATATPTTDDPFGEPPGVDAAEAVPAESSDPSTDAAEEDPFGGF